MGDHSSRRRIAPPLKQPTRATSRNQAHVPPLFGLAPGGVCHAGFVTEAPVRSYRTLSLSRLRRLRAEACATCSLLHFPWGHPRRALPGTAVPWSPDFPLPRMKRGSGRPTLWRSLSSNSPLAVQEQAQQDGAALTVDLAVDMLRPEAALECRDRRFGIAYVIAEPLQREQETAVGP